jgi:hypothetical protein
MKFVTRENTRFSNEFFLKYIALSKKIVGIIVILLSTIGEFSLWLNPVYF